MNKIRAKTCLVITYGPVPTPQYQTVEGGGMRAWGLAKGLQANGIDTTVGVNNSFPQEVSEHEGVKLLNWGLDDAFAQLINSFDAVIVSYCMGDPSVFIADRIADHIQLILDVYVPIYVEVAARESNDIATEFKNYIKDIARHNHVLKRGDYFLCANEAQKTFYVGILASLGVINPRSYRDERILIAPFGIHDTSTNPSENPYTKLGIKTTDFVLLWFGGLYPWFHVEELLDAILELSTIKNLKFVFVGAKNPFNPNPDFYRQYEKAVKFAKQYNLADTSMFFVDWVDFDKRIDWYQHANAVISLNQPGEENKFSWRTRVMDYVWGEMAILTNGGDPLSEDLIEADAAIRLPELSSKAIYNAVYAIHKDPKIIAHVKNNIADIKHRYFWHVITKSVQQLIDAHKTPYLDEVSFKKRVGVINNDPFGTTGPDTVGQSKVRKLARVPVKTITHVRRKGLRRTVKLAIGITRTQIKKRTPKSSKRRYVFISHPIDNTGAPLVLLEMIEEFAKRYGGKQVQLIAPAIQNHQLKKLRQLGVAVDKAAFGLSARLIRLQLGLRSNDFVLMNTVAIYDCYRDFIMLWLRNGRLKHAYWFIHEDIAQLPVINKQFLDKKNVRRITQMTRRRKLTVLTPSERTKQEYNKLLEIDNIRPINLRVNIPKKYTKERPASDYRQLNFVLSGTASDGRKGQLIAISAFYTFLKDYYAKNPDNYRDFTLHLIALGQDYISQQIRWIGSSELGKRVVAYEPLPRDEALAISSKCNAVICCSLNETFGLYVAEGMLMGHVVVRNNSAGMKEQLKEGINGFYVDHTDVNQFASVIEKLLNKNATSDEDLRTMGIASQKMISSYQEHTYLEQIEAIES